MSKRAGAMNAGVHPRATARGRCVAERNPASQVVLRLYILVTIVLVPGEGRPSGALVDGLVPVQPHAIPDEIVAQIAKDCRSAALFQDTGFSRRPGSKHRVMESFALGHDRLECGDD